MKGALPSKNFRTRSEDHLQDLCSGIAKKNLSARDCILHQIKSIEKIINFLKLPKQFLEKVQTSLIHTAVLAKYSILVDFGVSQMCSFGGEEFKKKKKVFFRLVVRISFS